MKRTLRSRNSNKQQKEIGFQNGFASLCVCVRALQTKAKLAHIRPQLRTDHDSTVNEHHSTELDTTHVTDECFTHFLTIPRGRRGRGKEEGELRTASGTMPRGRASLGELHTVQLPVHGTCSKSETNAFQSLLQPHVWCFIPSARSLGYEAVPIQKKPTRQKQYVRVLILAPVFVSPAHPAHSLPVRGSQTRRLRHTSVGLRSGARTPS